MLYVGYGSSGRCPLWVATSTHHHLTTCLRHCHKYASQHKGDVTLSVVSSIFALLSFKILQPLCHKPSQQNHLSSVFKSEYLC